MIDIKKILEEKEATKRALLKRLSEGEFDLDKIEELDRNRKEIQHQFDTKRAEQNKYNDKMARLKKLKKWKQT
jgi:seryl-tRNA synthetase